ncbi:Autotransporter beta-domain-containing protein [Succinivibrio dextrinosolvens DSM 3072]|uniref:Autotransporter beta-domain-containing protein n=1 Tax=Succinivibrio dextrinosolvens DSM 3072 TaxID=1123324 RepID=A0A1T4UWC1_9GAMM|nr:Autotransporter beta-domain-containing protein [Succinivibrio dextrinosolvens DSM 3072]
MKRNTLNRSEDFTFEGRLLQTSSTNCPYKKNSPRIKPLAVALSIVLAGLSFSNQVEAIAQGTAFSSPWIVEKSETVNLTQDTDNQINVIPTTNNVIAVIYGTINFESSAFIYPNRTGLPFNSYNSITVYGQILGSGNNNLFGAYNKNHASNLTLQTSNNTVIFKAGSKVDKVHVYGAKIDNTAGDAIYAYANSNTVIIEKGSDYTGNCYVVGGYALSKIHATASDNKIIIGSGTFTSEIIAGWTTTKLPSQKATMSDNEVYLYGDADVSEADIYGAIRTGDADSGTTVMTGNTLIFGYNNSPWAPANYTINSVNNFSTIRMDALTWGKTITINSLRNNSTDSTETKINAENVSFSAAESLSPGVSYDMLTVSNVAAGSSIGLSSESSTFTIGSTLEGTASLKLQNNTVTYTVNGTETQPQTHTAAMTMSAGTVALTQGGDTLSAAGFNLANSGINGTQAFSAVGGGMARVNTGSHVNVNTLNFSVGVGNNIQNDYGQLSVGAAFEAGFGKFKNHFNAGKADPYIKKNGDIKYYGIAVLSNMAFENLWHVNGALRYGRIETSQNRAVYNFNTNQTYDVDLSSYYIGAELGGGKVIKLDDLNSLDLYGKYFFLHQDGNTFNAGGKYELSSVDSHRLRLAGRYSHNYTPTTALYTGLGAEYEFDGKSELKVDGFWAKPSKTDGIRGFGELGVTITPASNKGLIFDFGIKGLLGDGFRGAWANAEMKYLF